MSDKVYTTETITTEALPVAGDITVAAASTTSTKSTSTDTAYTSPVTTARKLPERLIAYATISESINTQYKKILGDYSFGVLGALTIGKYEHEVSAELRLSPSGMTAVNINGETTFAIDVATGDATFKGTLQAGTIIAGDSKVVVEGSETGGRMMFYDSSNIPSILLGYA